MLRDGRERHGGGVERERGGECCSGTAVQRQSVQQGGEHNHLLYFRQVGSGIGRVSILLSPKAADGTASDFLASASVLLLAAATTVVGRSPNAPKGRLLLVVAPLALTTMSPK